MKTVKMNFKTLSSKPASAGRLEEIDVLRGIAIVLMIVFHLIVDLKDFFSYNVEYLTGFWYYVGKLSAILFILTAGISATLSRAPSKHGVQVFLWGMVLTLITYWYNPLTYIRFGILHLLGFSIASYSLIARLRPAWLTALGISLISAGILMTPLITTFPYLLPLGFITKDFATLDYYPLLPWYGVFLVGAAAGKTVYRMRESKFTLSRVFRPLSCLGQHSLVIYLAHQPILLGLLYLTIKK